MTNVQSVFDAVNLFAPFDTAEEYDNVGLLCGGSDKAVSKIAVALDATAETILTAVKAGAEVLVTHHPIIFNGLKSVADSDPVSIAIKADIDVICAHTNFDIAPGGLSDEMARVFGLSDVVCAGCAYHGKFNGGFDEILAVAKANYADVRYDDRAGVKAPLTVGVCSGGGFDYFSPEYDVFVTGDVRHHQWLQAAQHGVAVIDCGHYGTEIAFERLMAGRLRELLTGVEVVECGQERPFEY